MKCPLCGETQTRSFVEHYFHCTNCEYIFLDPAERLSAEEEKKIYDFHQNDPQDQNYRGFLSQISTPLIKELKATNDKQSTHKKTNSLIGLDFGCGPGPTLSLMLEEEGFKMENYDPIYFPNEQIFNKQYDFITSTEVFEHLHKPKETIEKLLSALKPKGALAIMTLLIDDGLQSNPDKFSKWFYKNDPTHVGFFSRPNLEWIAKHYNLDLEIWSKRCLRFKKNSN